MENKASKIETGDEDVVKKGAHRQLVYGKEFKDFIREYRVVIPAVLELIQEAREKREPNKPIQKYGISLTPFVGGFAGFSDLRLFKVDAFGKSFFLKKEPLEEHNETISWRAGGFEEFRGTKKAAGLLAKVPWVKVVNPQLGYQDKENSYFVADWIYGSNLVNLAYHLEELEEEEDYEPKEEEGMAYKKKALKELKEIRDKVEKIRLALPGAKDLNPRNMLYDTRTGEMILFDLALGQ